MRNGNQQARDRNNPAPPIVPLDSVSFEDLIIQMTELQTKYEEMSTRRNYVQQERDILEKYCINTEVQVKESNNKLLLKANELQTLEENHRIELRTYLQKIKQLEFEAEKDVFNLELHERNDLTKEEDHHKQMLENNKHEKDDLKDVFKDKQSTYLVKTSDINKKHNDTLNTAKAEFIKELKKYEEKCKQNLADLKHELDLKIKTELNEIEERKNYHINELIKNHEKAYDELRAFYNYITVENLGLIKAQKDEKEKSFKRHEENQKKINALKEKNAQLEVI